MFALALHWLRLEKEKNKCRCKSERSWINQRFKSIVVKCASRYWFETSDGGSFFFLLFSFFFHPYQQNAAELSLLSMGGQKQTKKKRKRLQGPLGWLKEFHWQMVWTSQMSPPLLWGNPMVDQHRLGGTTKPIFRIPFGTLARIWPTQEHYLVIHPLIQHWVHTVHDDKRQQLHSDSHSLKWRPKKRVKNLRNLSVVWRHLLLFRCSALCCSCCGLHL